MPAVLLPNGKQAFFTTPGVPAVGYKLMTWAAGTTTPQTTWADALKVAANANPIVLDARGEAVIFWDGAYKIQLQDSTGAPVWPPIDNVQSSPAPSGSLIPTVDNSFTVGSPAFSWANVYVGVNHAPVLDTVSGNIGYYIRTPAEAAAGVTPVNLAYAPMNLLRYGADPTGAVSAVTAFNNALLAYDYVLVPPGIYKIDSVITITGNKTITGPYGGSKSAEHATLNHTAVAGAVFSALSNEFGGIYIGNLDIQGGNGSYAIVSARPQSLFEFIHMEGATGYNGGGIQLQSGGNGATAPGSWECTIRDCKWVAPTTQTAYRGYDLTINGGAVNVERCIATRGSIGFALNQGATVRFIACDASFQNVTYSSESNTVGQAAFKFKTSAGAYHNSCEISGCYVEVSTAGVWIDECTSLKISNTLTNDASTFGSGGVGVYLAAAAQGVTVSNCNITLNYASEIGIDNLGANTVLENNMILALSSVAGTAAYRTTTAMTVMNSLPLASSVAPTGYIFAGAPIDANHLISDLTGDPRSFVGTLTGCLTAPTVTVTYVVSGRTVTLNIPAVSAASSTTGCAITGVPNSIIPASGTYTTQCTGLDNTVYTALSAIMAAGSAAITLSKGGSVTGFTNGGTKGINASTITYLLA